METDKIENNDYSGEKEDLAKALDFHKKGDYGRAEAIYREIYKRNPGNSDALHFSALILYHYGFFDSAAYWIKRSIGLNGSIPQYYYNLGLVHLDNDNASEAFDCFNKSEELDPRYYPAEEMIKLIKEKKYGA